MDPAVIVSYLGLYGYPIMFILMYFEGPIVTFISAFLASLGLFNLAIVWCLSFLGDFLNDLVHFYIGDKGHAAIIKRLEKNGLTHRVIMHLQNSLHKNLFYSLLMIKVAPPPISTGGLFLVGTLKNKRKKAIFYTVIICLILESISIMLGYFSGSYFQSLLQHFNGTYLLVMFFAAAIVVFFIIRQVLGNISKKVIIEKE